MYVKSPHGGNTNAREKSFRGRCHCPSCVCLNFGLDLEDCTCEEASYNREICCDCEDFLRSGPRGAAELAQAVLHSGCDLSERERSILEARTNDEWDLRDVALDLGITWKQALEIEEPLLAKMEAPSGGLSERARQILEQRAWRQAAGMGKGSIKVHLQVEGNVIRIGRVAAAAAGTVKL